MKGSYPIGKFTTENGIGIESFWERKINLIKP
jgi:hypothetical protein